MPGIARIVRRDERARKPRSRRPASRRRGARDAARMAVRTVSDPEATSKPDGADVVGWRTTDAGNRPRADDAAQDPDPGRTDAWPRACHSRTIVEGAGAVAPDHADHGIAG